MSQRAQLKHVLLDVDFFGNPKIRALSRKHGLNGTLALIEIYCCMSRATNAVIDSDALLCIAEDNALEAPEEFLKYCLSNGLVCEEGGGYSNSRVIKDQESLYLKRDKERNRQQKHRVSRVTHASEHMSPDPVYVTDIEDLNKNGALQFGEFVWLTDLDADTWKAKLGIAGFERACEKLNGWIGQVRNDIAEFQRRKMAGCNASFTFQNWVARAIEQERSRDGPSASSGDFDGEAWMKRHNEREAAQKKQKRANA